MDMPRKTAEELIDYFLVRKETKARVQGVKVAKEAGLGSDHHRVLIKLSIKIKGERKNRMQNEARVRIERLKDKCEQLRYQCRISYAENE